MRFQRKNSIPGLDAFRGLLAIWVFWFHSWANDHNIFKEDSVFSRISQRGYMGVDGFFSLSGFIIMHVYQKDFIETKGFFKKYSKFLYFRIARIWPLHCVMSLFWINGIFMNRCRLGDYFTEITLTTPFFYPSNQLGVCNLVCWSILNEFYAYLAFPLLITIFKFFNKNNTIFINIIIIFCFYLILISAKSMCHSFSWHLALHFVNDTLFEFFTGMALYKIYEKSKKNHFFYDVAVIVLIGYVILCSAIKLDIRFYEGILLVFPLVLAGMDGWMKMICESEIGKFLGDISFSFYLSHLFWIQVFQKNV